MKKESNVVLNFKMNGQVEYAKTIRDINAIMNAAASEYKTHIAAMGKDADQTKKLAAEKKKLEAQLEAGRERTRLLRAEYEAMAKDTTTTTAQLANKYKQLQNSERAEIALENALHRVNEGLSEQAIKSREAEQALNQLEIESDKLENQTKKLNAEYELQKTQLGENASESKKLKLEIEHLNKSHDIAKNKVKNYEQQLEQAKLRYGENSEEVVKYETKLLEARTAEQQLANEIKKANKELKKQANILETTGKNISKAGKKITEFGKGMTTKVTTPLVGFAGIAGKIGSDFEASMSQVAAISGATGEDLDKLTNKAREMGATTQFSASESAEALNYMALAGWSTNDMLEGISGVMNLAAASGEDLAMVSDIVTDGLSAFGLSAKEAGRMADVLAAASANSNTNVNMLGQAFSYVAPVAGALGFSIEDTSKAIGLMSNAGIKSTKAGTALRGMMTNLAKPTESMQKEMEKLGISLTDSEGNMKSFNEIMGDLRISFADLTEDQQASAAATLFGKESMSGALAIINASEEDFNNLGSAINESSGAANQMATVMQDNLQGRMKEMKSAFEEAAISIYDNLQPAFESVVAGLKAIADWFNNLSPAMQNTIVVVGILVAAIGPLLMALGFMASGVGAVISIAGKFISVLGLLGKTLVFLTTNPVGLTITAIGLLVAAGVALWKNWDTVKEKATQIWGSIKETISKAINGAKNAVEKAINAIKNLFNFQFKWPKLKMPKFKIQGSMNPVKWLTEGVPKLSVDWHAKGGIFTQPTIFGMSGGRLQGAGEAGPEAVLPLNEETLGAIGKGIAEASGAGNVVVHVYLDTEEVSSKIAPSMSRNLNNMNKLNARSQGVITP